MRTRRNPGTASITKVARGIGQGLPEPRTGLDSNISRDCGDEGEGICCSNEDAMQLRWIWIWPKVVQRRPSPRLERGRKKRIGNVIRGLYRIGGRGHKQRYDQYTGLIEEVQKKRKIF